MEKIVLDLDLDLDLVHEKEEEEDRMEEVSWVVVHLAVKGGLQLEEEVKIQVYAE